MHKRLASSHFCKACGIEKNTENSYKHNSCEFQTLCKTCSSDRQKERCKEDPDAFKRAKLKHRYNLSLEDWKLLLKTQENCCKICSNDFGSKAKNITVDHDHMTGKIRGLLCRECNILLGHHEKILREGFEKRFTDYLKGAK